MIELCKLHLVLLWFLKHTLYRSTIICGIYKTLIIHNFIKNYVLDSDSVILDQIIDFSSGKAIFCFLIILIAIIIID